jgi:Leucine-rich repeat (LRR) protein
MSTNEAEQPGNRLVAAIEEISRSAGCPLIVDVLDQKSVDILQLQSLCESNSNLKSICGARSTSAILDLSGRLLGSILQARIVSLEVQCNNISSLDLSNNRLAFKAAGKALSTALKICPLTSLNVSSNVWRDGYEFKGDGPGFVKELAAGIYNYNNQTLTCLNVSNNNMQDICQWALPDGWSEMRGKGYKHTDGREQIEFPGAKQLEGMLALMNAIQENAILTSLDLSSNSRDLSSNSNSRNGKAFILDRAPQFAQCMLAIIPAHRSLVSLNILGNRFPLEVAKELISMISTKEALTTLCGLSGTAYTIRTILIHYPASLQVQCSIHYTHYTHTHTLFRLAAGTVQHTLHTLYSYSYTIPPRCRYSAAYTHYTHTLFRLAAGTVQHTLHTLYSYTIPPRCRYSAAYTTRTILILIHYPASLQVTSLELF